METREVILIYVLLGACFQWAATVKTKHEQYRDDMRRLHLDLMVNYSKELIPVNEPHQNETSSVTVRFGMAIIQIDNVNPHDNKLTLHAWLRMVWKDARLAWDPADYAGITTMRIPVNLVWTPDLTLYNSAEVSSQLSEPQAVIYNSGDVLYIPVQKVTPYCQFDLTYFPYDKQECFLKWGSWTHDGFQMDLEFYEGLTRLDLSDFEPHHEWTVVNTAAKRFVKYYPCCSEPYPDLTFNLTIHRRGQYYTYSYVAPAVLCALLTCLTFLIPTGNNQKFNMGCCLLILMTLLLIRIEQVLPTATARLPVLVQYYVTNFILLAFALGIQCLTGNMMTWAKSSSPPPVFIKKVLLGCLGRCLCIRRDRYMTLDEQVLMANMGNDGEDGESGRRSSIQQQVEWRLVAVVLDRIFFLVFFVLMIIFCASMLHADTSGHDQHAIIESMMEQNNK